MNGSMPRGVDASRHEVTADLFAFLTTEPNAEVGAVHPRAMPVILATPSEWRTWLTAPWSAAISLQRPLPDGGGAGGEDGQRVGPLALQASDPDTAREAPALK